MSSKFDHFLIDAKWKSGKKKSNFDGHGEIDVEILVIFHIILLICFRDCILPPSLPSTF